MSARLELDFVRWLRKHAPNHPDVVRGIGDDAAVLAIAGEQVITKDVLADGVHFESAKHEPFRIGRKSIAVNLSDLAAMGAEPVAVFVGIFLPKDANEDFVKEIYRGIFEICDQFQISLAGGDTNVWQQGLVISVTAVGKLARPQTDQVSSAGFAAWTRDSAKVGDKVVVSGQLGGSILGHHLDFEPRVEAARKIRNAIPVHACMDISDGLLVDLSRICEASRCGAQIELNKIPISNAAEELTRREGVELRESEREESEREESEREESEREESEREESEREESEREESEREAAKVDGHPEIATAPNSSCIEPSISRAMRHALSDGEDFELLMVVDPADAERIGQIIAPLRASVVGEITPGEDITIMDGEGAVKKVNPDGYLHKLG